MYPLTLALFDWTMVDPSGAVFARWRFDSALICLGSRPECFVRSIRDFSVTPDGAEWKADDITVRWTKPDGGQLTVGDVRVRFQVKVREQGDPLRQTPAFTVERWTWDEAVVRMDGVVAPGVWVAAAPNCHPGPLVYYFSPLTVHSSANAKFLVIGTDGAPALARDVRKCDIGATPPCNRPIANRGVVLDGVSLECL